MSDNLFLFFFFQAEDGIRDLTVTGVQTCALPISIADRSPREFIRPRSSPRWRGLPEAPASDRKSTRLNSSHSQISYAVFCLKKKKIKNQNEPQLKDATDQNDKSVH